MAKARIALLTALLAALGFGALPFLAGCGGHGKNDIDRLAWLSGCWEGKSDGAVVQEQWSKPAGGTLLGTGRRIAGGKTVFHEYMHIGETNSGLLFVAHPGGGEGTPFRLQKAGKNKALDMTFKDVEVSDGRLAIEFTYEVELPWYLRREGPGLLIGMGNVASDEEDPQVDWSFLDEVIEHSIHRAPALAEAGVKTAWAGLRPVTPDDNPILGPAQHLEGFWNDCGWGGHGIMHAPAGGLILAEWIVDGRASTIDARGFTAGRFAQAGGGGPVP